MAVRGDFNRLYRVNLKSPNEALSQWLSGPQCAGMVEARTAELFAIYESMLPTRTNRTLRQPAPGHLKRSAYYYVARAGFGPEKDRWMGYVGNSAVYAAVIEWGSREKNIEGQHTLLNAGALMTNQRGRGRPIPTRTLREDRYARQIDRAMQRKDQKSAAKERGEAQRERANQRRREARAAAKEKAEAGGKFRKTQQQNRVRPAKEAGETPSEYRQRLREEGFSMTEKPKKVKVTKEDRATAQKVLEMLAKQDAEKAGKSVPEAKEAAKEERKAAAAEKRAGVDARRAAREARDAAEAKQLGKVTGGGDLGGAASDSAIQLLIDRIAKGEFRPTKQQQQLINGYQSRRPNQ